MEIFLTAVVAALATLGVMLLLSNLSSGQKAIKYSIAPRYGVDDPRFERSMGHLLGPPLIPGNRITALQNGREIFPAVFAAIAAAQHSITFETFIYWEGETGRRMAQALAERARAGVQVHVLLDWFGSKSIDETYVDTMKDAGVEVERYHPIRWYTLDRVNQRTHRKIIVVDGRVAFTGGLGIADVWLGDAEDPSHWRDSHYQIEGPAAAQLQAAFMDNWMKTHTDVLHGENYFPVLEPVGEQFCQVFKSSPREGSESMRLMFLLSIACARRSIRIGNSYFVPDDLLIKELVRARERGVEVQILTPGPHNDARIVRHASRGRWGALLRAGCEMYEFQPTMYHCKLLVVDDVWVSVGSSNLDNRSLRLNDEANLNVLHAGFAREQAEVFERDLTRSQRVTLEVWQKRPLREKLVEWLSSLLRSQL